MLRPVIAAALLLWGCAAVTPEPPAATCPAVVTDVGARHKLVACVKVLPPSSGEVMLGFEDLDCTAFEVSEEEARRLAGGSESL